MNYGIFRKGHLNDKKERLVCFVDLGHSKTSIFFAKLWKGKAEIILEKNDRNLGVRNLDRETFKHFADVFQQKNKVDLRESPKSIYRLLVAIEKFRKVLSTNP